MRALLAAALALACSAGGGDPGIDNGNAGGTAGTSNSSGGSAPEAGSSGEAGAPSIAGAAGTSGTGADLCQAGDERLCSCAPGYGGKQTCSDFGWNLCVCPDWPPPSSGGAAGAPSGPALGSDCMTGTDECLSMNTPIGKPPVCMQSDGIAGGTMRPGHCTWTCTPGASDAAECIKAGGECQIVGELVSHCVAW